MKLGYVLHGAVSTVQNDVSSSELMSSDDNSDLMGGSLVKSSPVFTRRPFISIDNCLKLWRHGAFQLIFETFDVTVVSMDHFLKTQK